MSRRTLLLITCLFVVAAFMGCKAQTPVSGAIAQPTDAATAAHPTAGATAAATAASPAAATPTATVSAAPAATARLTAAPASLSGLVTFAGAPVPGAQVTLRQPGWAVSADPAAKRALGGAVADAQGSYTIPRAPAGEYSVVGSFPKGEDDAAGWPAVTLAPGQSLQDVNIALEHAITITLPAPGAVITDDATLAWEPLAGAVQYRVLVIDAGTTAQVAQETTTNPTLSLTGVLYPGATCDWVVTAWDAAGNALGQGVGRIQADGRASDPTKADTKATNLPPTCQVSRDSAPDARTRVAWSVRNGFCFTYPARFGDPMQSLNELILSGPALDKSPDSLRTTLTVAVQDAGGQSLTALAEAYAKQATVVGGPAIERATINLGGVQAEELRNVPGRGGSREILAVQNGRYYRLSLTPWPEGFPQVQADVDALYQAVLDSFTFMQ